MLSLYGIIYVTWYTRHLRCVFQHLPEPNRAQYMACLVGVEKRGFSEFEVFYKRDVVVVESTKWPSSAGAPRFAAVGAILFV